MRVSIRFHKNSLPLSRVSQPRGVGGSTLRKSDDARRCSGSPAAPDDKRKDVYGRRLRGLKSRKFVNLHRRYGNVTSALGVLYPYGKPSMAAAWTAIYQRRGLTALLILWRRQCESLRPGISESRNSHVFFRTPLFHHLFTALFGSLRAQKRNYEDKSRKQTLHEVRCALFVLSACVCNGTKQPYGCVSHV